MPKELEGIDIDCEDVCCPHYSVEELKSINGGSVAIVGGGDVAFDYAMTLVCRGVAVTILVRGDRPKCNRELLGKVEEKTDLIQVITGASVRRVSCGEGSCTVTYLAGENHHQLEVDHLLCAIGRLPALGFLSESARSRLEELIKGERLFLIGDVSGGHFRQTAIAVGDGVRVGMKIGSLLGGQGETGLREGN